MLEWVKKCHEEVNDTNLCFRDSNNHLTSFCFNFQPSLSTCWASLLELRASEAWCRSCCSLPSPSLGTFRLGMLVMMVSGYKAYGEELYLEVL